MNNSILRIFIINIVFVILFSGISDFVYADNIHNAKSMFGVDHKTIIQRVYDNHNLNSESLNVGGSNEIIVDNKNSWKIFLKPYDGIQKNELFTPLQLPISIGDTVTWINLDSTNHKIVSGVAEQPDYSGEFFSTNILYPGGSFSKTFDIETQRTGFYYFCELHPWFAGKLFFEDIENIHHSILDISYDVDIFESLQISGSVESDLGSTANEIIVYDSKNNLVFQKLYSFLPDASFDIYIDTSSSMWKHDENYLLKLVYSVPSESTELLLHIPVDDVDSELKLNALEFCKVSDYNFIFQDILVPYWYSKSLCWFGNGVIVEKELTDALHFFQKLV